MWNLSYNIGLNYHQDFLNLEQPMMLHKPCCIWFQLLYSMFFYAAFFLFAENMFSCVIKKKWHYSHRGSNSGPLACEASVITN